MIPQRKKFYIAGPMTGIPQFNFPAFDVAAASLRSYGYLVVSPVELDDPSSRSAALANETGDPEQYNNETGETWGDLLARDVKLIADEVSGVVALEGWEESRGARLEVFVARTCGKPVYSYEEWLNDRTPGCPLTDDFLIPDWEIADVMHETVFKGDKFVAVGHDPSGDDAQPTVFSVPFKPIQIDPEVLDRLREADRKLREVSLMKEMADRLREAEGRVIIGNSHSRPFPKLRTDFKQIGEVTGCTVTPEGFKMTARVDDEDAARAIQKAAAFGDLYSYETGPGQPNLEEIKERLTKYFRDLDSAGAQLMSEDEAQDELTGEIRVTSETGGQKGRKPQRMDLLPPEALLSLSEVYGMGAEKYDDHNYLKGYDWSLSFGALLRHVMAAEKGEWLDAESGLPHVMHAAWHCFTLFLFEKHGIGTDDRLSSTVEGLQS